MRKMRKLWVDLRSSLWFIPVIMVLVGVGIAVGLVHLEDQFELDLSDRWPRVFGANADGSRGLLEAIATSMVTVTGVVFSIVIVALSLASNQYTPRILRNFMRDRVTKVVLGIFVSVFTYCLVVLRTVRAGDEPFVPSMAIAAAIGFALTAVGFLIYFIHHIAESIQASTIITSIREETIDALQKVFPEQPPDTRTRDHNEEKGEAKWQTALSEETGHLQTVATSLGEFAAKNDYIIRIEKRIGQFVIRSTPLFSVRAAHPLSKAELQTLRDYFVINSYRTIEQDPGFGIRQLVDIALKALSPGVNDVSTAISAVDSLGAILHCLVQRHEPPPAECIDDKPCVIYQHPSVEKLIDDALLQIRQSAGGNPAVLLRLLDIINDLAKAARVSAYREALDRHLTLIEEVALQSVKSVQDQQSIFERLRTARNECGITS